LIESGHRIASKENALNLSSCHRAHHRGHFDYFAEIWAFVAACWAGLAAYAMFGGAA
jgi:hypothetical protein